MVLRIAKVLTPILTEKRLLVEYVPEDFFSQFKELTRQEMRKGELKKISDVLASIERDFVTPADRFSLAFVSNEDRQSKLLFLRDLPNFILNPIKMKDAQPFDCIKASHHGTRFGASLPGRTTQFLRGRTD